MSLKNDPLLFFVYRNLVMQKEKRILSNKKLSCCSQLKYYIIIVSYPLYVIFKFFNRYKETRNC